MKIIITSKNFKKSDYIEQTIESKFQKLGKYFVDGLTVNVTLSSERGRDRVEATINAKGTIFRADVIEDDVITAVDRVVEKLSSQMSKYKSKLQKKHKDGKTIKFSELPDDPMDEVREAEVVKRKKFELAPMSVDEAIMQMELLGHNFFVFLDMDSDNVGVVYKRKDVNYGLLETDY